MPSRSKAFSACPCLAFFRVATIAARRDGTTTTIGNGIEQFAEHTFSGAFFLYGRIIVKPSLEGRFHIVSSVFVVEAAGSVLFDSGA